MAKGFVTLPRGRASSDRTAFGWRKVLGTVAATALLLGGAGSAGGLFFTSSAGASGTTPSGQLTVDHGELAYGTVQVGTEAAETVTVTNSGLTSVVIADTGLITGTDAADFTVISNSCSTETLFEGDSCEFGVEFAPATVGVANARLNIHGINYDTSFPQLDHVLLNGYGTSGLSVSPSSLTFGNVGVNVRSAPMTVTVSNVGKKVEVTNATVTGPTFSITPTTPTACFHTTLPAGTKTTCTIKVTAQPRFLHEQPGELHITYLGGEASTTVPLSVVGVADTTFTYAPTSLTFAPAPVGSFGGQKSVVITNTGSNPLYISVQGIANPAFTTAGSDCTFTIPVAAGASCSVDVIFTPTIVGSNNATLVLLADVSGDTNPFDVSLSGTGTTPASGVTATPVLTFGTLKVGVAGPTKYVVVHNGGTATVELGTPVLTTGAGYTITGTDTCIDRLLTAGTSCTYGVTFTPTAVGAQDGATNLPVETATGDETLTTLVTALYGTGSEKISASVAPTALSFGTVPVGQVHTKLVTVTNTGTVGLTVTGITVVPGTTDDAYHAISPACTTTVAPGDSCYIQVQFEPMVEANDLTGDLTIATNAGTLTVSLSGNGTTSLSSLSISPTPVNFGPVGLGLTSAPKTVTITDTGSQDVKITGISKTTGPDEGAFRITDDLCTGTTLHPIGDGQSTCTLEVTFTPADGIFFTPSEETFIELFLLPESVVLQVTTTSAGKVQTLLEGTATAITTATLTPTPVTFGTIPSGSSSGYKAVTLTNTGTKPLFVGPNGITFPYDPGNSPFHLVGGSCDFEDITGPFDVYFPVYPGQTCTFDIVFAPSTPGNPQSGTFGVITSADGFEGNLLEVILNGSSSAPQAGLDVTPFLTFGTVQKGVTGDTLYINVKNTGSHTIELGGVTVNSTPGDYTLKTDSCPTAILASGVSCKIGVAFKPSILGTDDGSVTLSVLGTTVPVTVPLYGAGSGTLKVVASPTTLNFPSTALGETAGPKGVTITNRGTLPVDITDIHIVTGTNNYAETSTSCGGTLAPTDSCYVQVTFSPTVLSSSVDGALQITDTAGTQTVSFTGSSTASPTKLSFSPNPVTFGPVGVGHHSRPVTITVTNTGTNPITLGLINTTSLTGPEKGEFKITTTDCSTVTLDALGTGNDSCTIIVVFLGTTLGETNEPTVQPQVPGFTELFGPQSVVLNLGSGGKIVAQEVLTATVVANTSATISPTPVTFGTVSAGSASAPQPVTITNTGTNPLFLGEAFIDDFVPGPSEETYGIVGGSCGPDFIDGPFAVALDAVILPGQSCTLDVVFFPETSGKTKGGTLTVEGDIGGTDSPGTGLSVVLQGNASTSASTLTITPYLEFGTVGKGVKGPNRYATITNNGTQPVHLGDVTVTTTPSDYTVVGDGCDNRTLGVGVSCVVGVNFLPTAVGTDDGTLFVQVLTSTTTLSSALYGTGTVSAKVTVTPTSLTFGTEPAGTIAGPKLIKVTNTGTVPVQFDGISNFGPEFEIVTTTCPIVNPLTPGYSCYITVEYDPIVASTGDTGNVTITDTAGSQSVTLHGKATANPGVLQVTPDPVNFGTVGVGNHSKSITVTLTNESDNPVTLNTVTATSITGATKTQFTLVTSTCSGATLDAHGTGNDSCTTVLTFTPTSYGPHTDALTFDHNGKGAATAVLTGTGITLTSVSVSTTEVDFGKVVDPATAPQPVTITNNGIYVLNITTIDQSGPDSSSFTIVGNGCTDVTVVPGTSCTFYVLFDPQNLNSTLSTILIITANVPGGTPTTHHLTVLLLGTGTSPTTSLEALPATLTFGTVGVGVTAPTQYVTIKNTGNALVTITPTALSPTNADYTISANTCTPSAVGIQLAAGATCVIGLSFTPSVVGNDDTAIQLPVGGGTPLDIPVFGVGSNSLKVTVTPSTLTFGQKALNQSSAEQWVTITNTGTAPLTLDTITIDGAQSGNFTIDHTTCFVTATLDTGQSCEVPVTFVPTTVSATLSAHLDVTDTAGVQSVLLKGSSTASTTSLGVTPDPVTLGSVGITETASKSVTITNTGNSKLKLSKTVTVTGTKTFTVVDGCATLTLDTAASNVGNTTCSLTVVFSPTSFGSKSAILKLTQAGPTGSVTDIVVTGTAVAKTSATLTPSTFSFGTVPATTVSPDQAFTVTNTGANPLYLHTATTSITGIDPATFTFSTDTCSTVTVLPGASCTIFVYFKPTVVGARTAELTVGGNFTGPGTTKLVAHLSGTAATPGLGLTVTPKSLDFGAYADGVTSPSTYVVVKNTGSQAITLGTPAVASTDYTVTSTNCKGVTLSPGAICGIGVDFHPTITGADGSTLTIPNTGGPDLIVPLSGSGTNALSVKVNPTSLTFPSQAVGTASGEKNVTVTNDSATTINISTVGIHGSDDTTFQPGHTTCFTATLAPDQTCQVAVYFLPTQVSSDLTADIDIVDNAGTQSVTLTGKSTASETALRITPTPFGTVGLGDSETNGVTVANVGTKALKLGKLSIAGPDATEFEITGDGCTTMTLDAPGTGVTNTSCTVQVVFTPDASGTQTAVIDVPHNGGGATAQAVLTGTGVASTSVAITPTSINFGTVPEHDASPAHQVTLTNTGKNPLLIKSDKVSGKDAPAYTIVNDFCMTTTILPGESCTVFVVFGPTTVGAFVTAELAINANVTGNTGSTTLAVPMTGTGTTAGIGLVATPPFISFGTFQEGVTSPTTYVTVKNTSDQAISIVTVTIDPSPDYTITSTSCTGTQLSPGATCVFGVNFDPTANGADDATATVAVTGGPDLLVPLYGTGTPALNVTITPTSLTFARQPVGHISGEKVVTFTNTTHSDVTISSVTLVGIDSLSYVEAFDTCTGITLQPGQSCTVEVAFAPATVSTLPLSADLEFFDNAGVQHVSLNGTSSASSTKLVITPSPVTFGPVGIDVPQPETITVTNTGTSQVVLGTQTVTQVGITVTGTKVGQFHVTSDNCSDRTLDAPTSTVLNDSCHMVVTFTPLKYGEQSAILEIPQATPPIAVNDVVLDGKGVGTTTATISPKTLTFGTIPGGGFSASQRVVVTDTGTNPLYVRTIMVAHQTAHTKVTANYTVVADGCTGMTLVPGQSCTLYVVFDPQTVGENLDAVLEVHANITNVGNTSILSVALRGNGTTKGVGLTATPGVLDFGAIGLNVTGPTDTVTVTNNGTDAVKIGPLVITGPASTDFVTSANACTGKTLSPGATCTVAVTFKPTALGIRDATLEIPTTVGKTLTVGLYGDGVPATTLTIAPPAVPGGQLTFPTTGIGHLSAQKFITITNTGPNPLDVDTATLNPAGDSTTFTVETDTCATFLVSPGNTCVIGIVFSPEFTLGQRTDTLILTDNGPTSQQAILLVGTATNLANGSGYSVTPTKLAFGSVSENLAGTAITVVVTNKSTTEALVFGTSPAKLTTNVNFSITADLCTGATLDTAGHAGDSCTIQVNFNPTVLGARKTNLIITPKTGEDTLLKVTGIGVAQVPSFTLTPPNGGILNFGEVLVDSTSTVKTVLVKVTSPTTALTINKVTIVGNVVDAKMFAIVTTTCVGDTHLTDGATCEIVMDFTPSSLGQKTAQLLITDNAGGTPQLVYLTGTGVGTTSIVAAGGTPGPGYDLVGSDGGVFVFPVGQTHGFYGSLPGIGVVPFKPIVGMVPTVGDLGYFLVGADGGVFAFGDAPFLGSLPGIGVTPNQPITGIIAANTDKGYFLVGRDGGVFAFGTVPFLGSLPGRGISVNNIIGIASEPTGLGYWVISSTGTVYAFGSALSLGTVKGTSSPVTAIAGTPTGGGYWVTTASGAVYSFGNAKKYTPGTLPAIHVTPFKPVIGIVHTPNTDGYWLLGADGGIFAFGGAGFKGSLPGITVHVDDIVGAVPN